MLRVKNKLESLFQKFLINPDHIYNIYRSCHWCNKPILHNLPAQEMPRNKHQCCHHLHMHIGWLNTDGCSNCSDACVCLLCHGNHSAIGGGRNSRNLAISCQTRQERSDPNPQRLSRVNDLLQCFSLVWTESSDAGFALPLYLLRVCRSNKRGSNRSNMTNKIHKSQALPA